MHAPSAAVIAAIIAVLASPTAMAIEGPEFRLLTRDGAFELRQYSAYVIAETRVETDFSRAGGVGFQRLFRYISGKHLSQQRIAMTAPVTQSRGAKGEKIAMTAPVSQIADGTAYRVAFTLPATYQLATAPKPLDPTVEIREVPARLIACWR